MTRVPIKRTSPEGKPLTVRVDAALDRRLHAAAAREGVSVSDFVREAIAERVDRAGAESSLWDRIQPSVVRRGRAGGGTGRSTRPKDGDTHTEFSAGLEADAAKSWRRGDE